MPSVFIPLRVPCISSVSAVLACAYRGGITPPLHTIGILPYICDANIDTKCYTDRRFIIAAYGMLGNSPAADLKL